MQCHFLSRSENQYGRQVAILNFEQQTLKFFMLFLINYFMDCFQILYTDSPCVSNCAKYLHFEYIKKSKGLYSLKLLKLTFQLYSNIGLS